MATTAEPVAPQAENISFQTNHQEIAFPLPRALHTTVHIHLTFQPTHTMVFLATTMPGDSGEKPLGSFVYAMPDRTSSRSALSTTLCPSHSCEEYATRIAKILATRTRTPAYVGCSINSTQLGLTVEEEMEGVRKMVDTIMERWERRQD